jgi:hypothetical protein
MRGLEQIYLYSDQVSGPRAAMCGRVDVRVNTFAVRMGVDAFATIIWKQT